MASESRRCHALVLFAVDRNRETELNVFAYVLCEGKEQGVALGFAQVFAYAVPGPVLFRVKKRHSEATQIRLPRAGQLGDERTLARYYYTTSPFPGRWLSSNPHIRAIRPDHPFARFVSKLRR